MPGEPVVRLHCEAVDNPAPVPLQRLHRRSDRGSIPCAQPHLAALSAQFLHDGPANATCATGHDRLFSCKSQIHIFPSLWASLPLNRNFPSLGVLSGTFLV